MCPLARLLPQGVFEFKTLFDLQQPDSASVNQGCDAVEFVSKLVAVLVSLLVNISMNLHTVGFKGQSLASI